MLIDYASAMNRQPILQDDSVILTPLRQDEFEELLAVSSDPLIGRNTPILTDGNATSFAPILMVHWRRGVLS